VCHKRLTLSLAFVVLLISCSSRPLAVDEVKATQTKLLGKWQAKGSIFGNSYGLRPTYTDTQFEFFADGSITESGKSRSGWIQERAGMFSFADAKHVKIDLGWAFGITIYEMTWLDSDHVTLRAADAEIIPLHRVNR